MIEATGALADAHTAAASFGERARRELDGLPDGEWRHTLNTMVEGVLAQV